MANDNIWPPPPDTEQPTPPAAQTAWQKLRAWMFAVPNGKRSAWEIIKWWELRRIPYNGIVLGVGIISLLLFFVFITTSGSLKDGEDAEEPLAIIAAPFLMNFAYTAGWVVECVLNWFAPEGTERAGPNLLAAGLVFSLFIVCLPAVIWFFPWLGHIFLIIYQSVSRLSHYAG